MGVFPSLLVALGSAPLSSSSCRQSTLPMAAALCAGVLPMLSLA